jgi:signal transduction histidine kinase
MTASDLTTISIALWGVVYLLVAIIALARVGMEPKANRSLALYAFIGFLWTLTLLASHKSWLPYLAADFTRRLPLYGVFVLSVFYFNFTCNFLRYKNRRLGWWILGVGWTAALLALDANWLGVPDRLWSGQGWMITRTGIILSGIVLGWAIFMIASDILTLQNYRRIQHPVWHNRIKYLAPVFTFLVLGDALFFYTYWDLGNAVRAVGVLIAAFVTTTQLLPSLKQATRKVAGYVLSTTLAIISFWVILFLAQVVYHAAPDYQPRLIGLVVAALIAIFVSPLLVRLAAYINRLVAGQSRDGTQLVRRYSQGISNILDVQLLAKMAIELLQDAFEIQQGYLFLVDQETKPSGEKIFHWHPINGNREAVPTILMFSNLSAVVQYLQNERRPLMQYDLEMEERFSGLTHTERDDLAKLGVDVYVPIYAQDNWIGLLALGPRTSGAPFLDEDRVLLSTLADQTAVALENARLVESLLRLNDEFRQAYNAMERAQERVEQLDRVKTDFIRIASDVLHEPIEVLADQSQKVLKTDPIDAQAAAKALKDVHNRSKHLSGIVANMLDMSAIDAKEFLLNPRPISLANIILELRKDLDSVISEYKQVFEVKKLNTLPLVEADREAVRIIFFHLMTNAIKFTPEGGRVKIYGRFSPPAPGDYPQGGVEIILSDTGIGVDPASADLIFSKFYQAGEANSQSTTVSGGLGTGLGLGLAIVKGLIDMHGGNVWVESSGHDVIRCPGSQFHVLLPIRSKLPSEPRKSLLQDI